MTATMTKDTATVIGEMLVENTGQHMCDSGGEPQYDANGNYTGSTHGYGRQYERNAGRDFNKEAEASFEIDDSSCGVTLSVYHWLLAKVDYDQQMDDDFHAFAQTPDQKDESWMCNMESFAAHLVTEDQDVTGLYGHGNPMLIYTYNHENILDQDIQFLYFEIEDAQYILLQTHNGCDARGGMSTPHAFKLKNMSDGAEIMQWGDARFSCSNDHDHDWSTDDGYHYYEGGSTAGTQLEDYTREEIELPKDDDAASAVIAARLADEPKLYYTTDGRAFCPECGGLLSAGM